MSSTPKRPKTLNRLQRLITDWERDSGMPVRRLNLRVAAMMLAGALARVSDDRDEPVFLTRGGVAIELRAGQKARVTRDVDLTLRADAKSLTDYLDEAFAETYEDFSFERDEPVTLPLRPQAQRVHVKVAFHTKPFTTLAVEVARSEAGEQAEHLPAHDLSTVGLNGPNAIPVLAAPWQIAQKLHALTEAPLRPGRENPRYWDLIDLQLLQALTSESLATVRDACVRTFAVRAQQVWPPRVTIFPAWAERYAAMAASLDMPVEDVETAAALVHDLIDRIDAARESKDP